MPPEISIVQGEVVPVPPRDELFLALWLDPKNFWQVSGVFYRNPADVEVNLAGFKPLKIVIVKFPMRALDSMSSEAREPHAIFLQTLGNWHWYDCKDCQERFSMVSLSEEIPRPRACPWCGLTYTQFKNQAGEFEPL